MRRNDTSGVAAQRKHIYGTSNYDVDFKSSITAARLLLTTIKTPSPRYLPNADHIQCKIPKRPLQSVHSAAPFRDTASYH
jgi:hypothetical protein